LETENWEAIARLALTQKVCGADLIDINISCPQEEKIIVPLFKYLQENTDCKFLIDSSNPNAILKVLEIYKGVPIINSINFDTTQNIFNKFEQFRPIYVFMTMKNGIICDIGHKVPNYLSIHNTYIDCCVESLDVNPNAFNELVKRVDALNYDNYRVLLGISNLSHHFTDRKIIDCAAYEVLKNRCAFIAKVDNVKYYARGMDLIRNIPSIQSGQLKKLEDYIINGIIPSKDILQGFITTMSKKEIEEKVLESLNYIGLQFEKRVITTYNLQSSARVSKLIFNEIFPVSGNTTPEVVIATVEGDFHDIGKTIVCSLMSAHKISFVDLGVNVPYEKIAKTISANTDVKIVGLSGLIYPSIDQAKKIIELVHKNFPGVLVYVGGAVFDKNVAKTINADGYFATALESVDAFLKILKK
jgi:5-methyltetrahydrofolate--homocysteine methyltransferase